MVLCMHRGAKTPHLKTTASPSKENPLYIPFLLIASTRNLAPPCPSDDPCNVQQICHTVCGLGSPSWQRCIKAPEFPQLWKFMKNIGPGKRTPLAGQCSTWQQLIAIVTKAATKIVPRDRNSSISILCIGPTNPAIQSGWNTCRVLQVHASPSPT